LARHLGKLHGKGYAEDFHKGMSGSGILSSLAGMLGLGHEEGPKSGGVQTGAYEGEGDRMRHHHGEEEVYTGGCYDSFTGAGAGDEMEGSGPISSIMGMFGLGDGEHSESDEEKPKGGRRRGPKKVKKPLMEGDGRLARAKIVRKVMADKGCSMIEASKYVKEHNLYHK
jgi:hypothetical protein